MTVVTVADGGVVGVGDVVVLAVPAEVPQVSDGAVPGADGGLREVP